MMPQENRVIDNCVYRRYMLHKFVVDIMSTDIVIQGQFETWLELNERGKWLQENCKEIFWKDQANHMMASRDVGIFGYMTEKQHTFYSLKFSTTKSYV